MSLDWKPKRVTLGSLWQSKHKHSILPQSFFISWLCAIVTNDRMMSFLFWWKFWCHNYLISNKDRMLQCWKWTSTFYVSVLRWLWLFLQTNTSQYADCLVFILALNKLYHQGALYTWHLTHSSFWLFSVSAWSGLILKKNVALWRPFTFSCIPQRSGRNPLRPSPQQVVWAIHKGLNEMHHQGGPILVTKVSLAYLSLNVKCVIRATH